MADRTLTINHADGGSETYTINRDKFAGVREMVVDGANVSVDRTAVPKEQSKETTFGGSKSITVNRDIEPLLSKVVGGAAAAYSLRDLNDSQGNNNVVRVRRESDNSEKDFRAKEVSNGTMARWVNEQPTLPLDLRELDTNTGERDGALIQAAAAYSLRKLKEDFTGDVVQVRRSSDDAVKSFTAAEVADGTLESWVGADVVVYTSNFSSSTGGWLSGAATLTSVDADADGSGNPPSDDWLRVFEDGATGTFSPSTSSYQLIAGLSYKLTAQVYRPAGSGFSTIRFKSTQWLGWDEVSLSEGLNEVSLPTTVVGGSGTGNLQITLTSTSTGDTLYLKNIVVTQTSANGHVKTWYDQSGNTNHATQTDTAKQPKIVDAGTYLGELDFDGTDDILNFTEIDFSTNSWILSAVVNWDGTDSSIVGASADKWALRIANSNNFSARAIDGTIHNFDPTATITTGDGLFTVERSSDVLSGYYDGDFDDAAPAITASSAFKADRIGNRGSTYSSSSVKELIIYDSDQSDNRTAIEANIGETYGITAIPAANDTVNGYVQTWYDQSGEGNDAEQPTAENQPKIVSAGTYLGELDFDGSDDFMQMESAVTLGTEFYLGMVVQTIAGESETNATFLGADSGGGGDRFYLGTTNNKLAYRNNGTNYQTELVPSGTEAELVSYTATASNITTALNGTEDVDAALAASMGAGYIGGGAGYNISAHFKELIIYSTDQSANRPAIETNIANQYGITLS